MTYNITSQPTSLIAPSSFPPIQDRKQDDQFRNLSSRSGPSLCTIRIFRSSFPSIPRMVPFIIILLLQKHIFLSLLLMNLSLLSPLGISLCLPRPLLQQSPLSLAQHLGLSVVDALQPVSEARSAERIDGVRPQGGAVEEGAHLDADLPEAHGQACFFKRT